MQWNKTGTLVAGNGSAGSGANQLDDLRCVYVDANDTVYVCDTGNERIQQWLQNAPSGTTVAGGSQGMGPSQLNSPLGLTFDQNGYLYVVDSDNCRVQRFQPPSTIGVTVAGGSCGSGSAQLKKPANMVVDSNGTLYVTDLDNKRVMKYTAGFVTGSVAFGGGSSFDKPYGIAFRNDSSNQIYVGDTAGETVELWTVGASTPTTTLVSNGIEPTTIAVDRYGNVYVSDRQGQQIKMFCNGSSTVRTVVGSASGTTPSLTDPIGIALDSNMNLYVGSRSPAGVYKYTRV